MKITRAVITAAGKGQRTLPLQTLIDRDGIEKSVLSILVEETLRAGVEEICVVVRPGDQAPYTQVAGEHAARLHFVQQAQPLGYGHAIYCAREFAGATPFLHLVGDHLYVSRSEVGCAQALVQTAEAQECAVSAVQATRESQLPYYGAVGGQRVPGQQDLYRIETVIEKPTPTQAEQRLIVPGLRAGHYLCIFGMHVLTPTVFDILEAQIEAAGERGVTLSEALAELARREQYLALGNTGWRYDIGARYGLLSAQVALALNGQDRDTVLTNLLELLALRELGAASQQ
jgi:UTP--glucose-1-phosphate uridylyltransferase